MQTLPVLTLPLPCPNPNNIDTPKTLQTNQSAREHLFEDVDGSDSDGDAAGEEEEEEDDSVIEL